MIEELQYSLNGKQPKIIGQICQGFCLIQHQIGFSIADFANVAYFKFSNNWVKLYFEPYTIFWREDQVPLEPVNDTLESMLVLVNLNEMSGIFNFVLESIEYGVEEDTVFVALSFNNGKKLVFSHSVEKNVTTLHC
jgi:hypothetical protein